MAIDEETVGQVVQLVGEIGHACMTRAEAIDDAATQVLSLAPMHDVARSACDFMQLSCSNVDCAKNRNAVSDLGGSIHAGRCEIRVQAC
ncbi:hypothetical protein [Aureimonas sp. AU22]|uniref:hypothetical protein n=1 Tax=Aureimonas sp. AU22 TaxID=1638162 RepID=UPI0012E3927C|nr:hypothetical protein [Aureimonas sp. AU22]